MNGIWVLFVLSLKLFCKFNFKQKKCIRKKDKNKVNSIVLEDRRKLRARGVNVGVAVEEIEVEACRRRNYII